MVFPKVPFQFPAHSAPRGRFGVLRLSRVALPIKVARRWQSDDEASAGDPNDAASFVCAEPARSRGGGAPLTEIKGARLPRTAEVAMRAMRQGSHAEAEVTAREVALVL